MLPPPSVYGLGADNAGYDAYATDHKYPKVGETRCYWTLVSSALTFVYLDPVLQSHLQDQADLLIGKSIIDFVHPDEQQSASRDLAEVLSSGNLDGTLTRMRFSRLSRVRRLLGYHGPPHFWPDAEKIAIDSNYMAVDLVVNVAADDLLLCFIHAAVDLTPHDNDRLHKSNWSNWCGTDAFTPDSVHALFDKLCRALSPSQNPTRVFQITANTAQQQQQHHHQDLPRALLFSWPPDPSSHHAQCHGPSARDFARLADGVNIDPESIAASNAKTACTRRFKVREQAMNAPDAFRLVDSVFIPHGNIIFACHQVKQQQARRPAATTTTPTSMAPATTTTTTTQTNNTSLHSLYMQPHQHYIDPSFSLPSMHALSAFSHHLHTPPHSVPSQTYAAWQQPPPQSHETYSWNTSPFASAAPPAPTYTTATTSAPAAPTPAAAQQQEQEQSQPTPQPQPPPPVSAPTSAPSSAPPAAWSYVPDDPYRTPASPAPTTAPTTSYYPEPSSASATASSFDDQPAAAPAPSGSPSQGPPTNRPRKASPSSVGSGGGTAAGGAGGGGRSGQPPAGVGRCSSCKVTHSPEWRKGPSGKKDLCNACGLRYARSRAKKEGVPAQRRRRDTGKAGAGGSTTATKRVDPPVAPAPAPTPANGEQQQTQQAPLVSSGLPAPAHTSSAPPVSAPFRRDSYEAYPAPGEYPQQQQQQSVVSTPSPPSYAQGRVVEEYARAGEYTRTQTAATDYGREYGALEKGYGGGGERVAYGRAEEYGRPEDYGMEKGYGAAKDYGQVKERYYTHQHQQHQHHPQALHAHQHYAHVHPHAHAHAHASTQLPPFHELPHTLSPSIAPASTRPAF